MKTNFRKMKQLGYIIIFFCLSYSGTAQEIWLPTLEKTTSKYTNKILKSTDLQQIYKDIPNDKLLQLERLTSYLFLELLNQYRAVNGLSQLKWDDNLWLAARNHNIYMASQKKNGHYEENEKSAFYTGFSPSDRTNFVYGQSGFYRVTENILYSTMYLRTYATLIVQEALQNWKNSPPHNENMLDPNHYATGVSLYHDIPNKLMYGTIVFSQDTSKKTHELKISWNSRLADIYKDYKGEENFNYCGNELKLGK